GQNPRHLVNRIEVLYGLPEVDSVDALVVVWQAFEYVVHPEVDAAASLNSPAKLLLLGRHALVWRAPCDVVDVFGQVDVVVVDPRAREKVRATCDVEFGHGFFIQGVCTTVPQVTPLVTSAYC